MTELIVRAVRGISADSAYSGYVGEDACHTPWAWLMLESSRAGTNDTVEVPDDQLLPCPPGIPGDRLLTLLAYWPAWRVTEWARIEIGSGVLIVGSGELAKLVAALCRCRGALWRGVWGAAEVREDGEFWFPLSGGQLPSEMLRTLPRQPDSILVLGGGAHEFTATLAMCRDLGTVVVAAPSGAALDLNLYADVHRRGLTIRAGSPFEYGPADVEAWSQAACRINTLIDAGLLALWKQ